MRPRGGRNSLPLLTTIYKKTIAHHQAGLGSRRQLLPPVVAHLLHTCKQASGSISAPLPARHLAHRKKSTLFHWTANSKWPSGGLTRYLLRILPVCPGKLCKVFSKERKSTIKYNPSELTVRVSSRVRFLFVGKNVEAVNWKSVVAGLPLSLCTKIRYSNGIRFKETMVIFTRTGWRMLPWLSLSIDASISGGMRRNFSARWWAKKARSAAIAATGPKTSGINKVKRPQRTTVNANTRAYQLISSGDFHQDTAPLQNCYMPGGNTTSQSVFKRIVESRNLSSVHWVCNPKRRCNRFSNDNLGVGVHKVCMSLGAA